LLDFNKDGVVCLADWGRVIMEYGNKLFNALLDALRGVNPDSFKKMMGVKPGQTRLSFF
jgi:hypothetical protein